jgi:hypothetical protein
VNYVFGAFNSGTLSVGKTAQAPISITGAPAQITFGDSVFTLGVSGGSGDGTAITWAVVGGNGAVTIDSAGVVTIVNAGTATIRATKAGDDSFSYAETTVDLTVVARSIAGLTITVNSVTYSGSPQSPTVTIAGLTQGEDFTVTFTPQTQAGSYNFDVVGVGNYSGTVQRTFTVNPKSVASDMISVTGSYTYTGSAITPTYSVTDGSAPLVAGVDYNVSITDNINHGMAAITITGIGNYTGTATANFNIGKANQAMLVITSPGAKTFGDTAFTLATTGGSGDGAVAFTSSNPAILGVSGNTATILGEGTVTVTAIKAESANHLESTPATYVLIIGRKSISGATFTVTSTHTYDGTAQSPTYTVESDGTPLISGMHFNANVTNNIYHGTATITVTGIGNYTGTESTTFAIAQRPLTIDFTAANKVYNRNTAATITSRTIADGLISGDAVTVSGGTALFFDVNVANNITVMAAAFTLSGASAANYTIGTINTTVADITPLQLTWNTNSTVQNRVYNGDNTATVATSPSLNGVFGGDTVTATVGTVTFASANVGTHAITAIDWGIGGASAGNYLTPTAQPVFADGVITALDVTGATVDTFAAMTFSGAAQTPSAAVTVSGLTATGTWSNVTNVSDTTTFTANGNFTGQIADRVTDMSEAIPTVATPPTASEVLAGNPLSEFLLSGGVVHGVGDVVLAGEWTWVTPTAVVTASGTFGARFTPTDPNYAAVTVNVNVTAAAIVTVSGFTTGEPIRGFDTLLNAFTAIGTTAGTYTITLHEDQTLTANRIIPTNQHITFVSDDATVRTITYGGVGNDNLFAIQGGSLTLNENITLQGRTVAGSGGVVNILSGTFTMQSGSRITGHNSATQGAVIVGDLGTFNMNGGIIDGCTGASVFVATTRVLNLSGNATIDGEVRLLSSTAITGTRINITDGWSGSVTTTNLRGAAAIDNAIAIWCNKQVVSGTGANPANIARLGAVNFANNALTPLTQPIAPAFYLDNDGFLRLDPSHATVTVTTGSVDTPHLNFGVAWLTIEAIAGTHTITLRGDQTISTGIIIGGSRNITLASDGTARTITHGGGADSNLFTVNGPDTNLILGNNVTIQGRSAAGGGTVVSIMNGTFTMQSGSRITGHNSNHAIFGAVHVRANTGRFNMEGGTINSNTGISVSSEGFASTVFRFSGNATITGVLQLTSRSPIGSVEPADSIEILAGWTGSITTLDLRITYNETGLQPDAIAGYWNNRIVITGTGTNPANIARIGLDQYVTSAAPPQRLPIIPGHHINGSGRFVSGVVPTSAPIGFDFNLDSLFLPMQTISLTGLVKKRKKRRRYNKLIRM